MTSQPRAYRSPLRERRTAETRRRITQSAAALFHTNGFVGTTIAAIARDAGVSPQTVYATFGSKGAILEALLTALEEDAGASRWREALEAEDDPVELLDLWARWTASMLETSREHLLAARGALQDPKVAELAARGEEHRRIALQGLVGRIATAGALRDGLPPEQAVDRAWALTGPELFLAVREGCGWDTDTYTAWVSEMLRQQLLCPAPGRPGAASPSRGNPPGGNRPSP